MKTLAFRLVFLVPIVAFAVYILVAMVGIVAHAAGAGVFFYCTVFCKTALGLLTVALIVTIYSQVRANRRSLP